MPVWQRPEVQDVLCSECMMIRESPAAGESVSGIVCSWLVATRGRARVQRRSYSKTTPLRRKSARNSKTRTAARLRLTSEGANEFLLLLSAVNDRVQR